MRLQVVGAVSAGFPSPASDYAEDRIDLNKELIQRPAATYFFRAAGESMTGAFIPPDALLVVDRIEKPVNGSIVVAVVDGEFTVKRLVLRLGQRELHPENPKYKPIIPDEFTNCEVWGVVTYVITNAKTV